MEQFSHKENPLDNISFDNISQEAAKHHKEWQVDTLQEAWHNDRVIKLLLKYIEEGKMTMDTRLGEALEMLDKRQVELLGEEWAKEGEEEEKI